MSKVEKSIRDNASGSAAPRQREPRLAALAVSIATISARNRLMATTRQVSGEWVERLVIEGAGRAA